MVYRRMVHRFRIAMAGRVTRADQARGPYHYVPFDLPQPAERLHVRYRYSDPIGSDQAEGGNVIDMGLFDPRGHAFPGGAGFRGWSGSARSAFTIGAADATPGYLPGPLPAGRYHLVLGLYRIWERGADYVVEVEAQLAAPAARPPLHAPADPGPPAGPSPSALRPVWLRGDLQCHSEHSDAAGSLAQLVAKARAAGLDFLAVTDHNTVSHHPHLAALADERLVLIPGQEATTYRGHMNIWGDVGWCDFRCTTDDELAQVIALAHARGGLCSINHPKDDGPAWEYGHGLALDAIEAWQGPWPWRNTQSLALWDRLLCAGRRVTGVGGSDYHCPSGDERGFLRLGQPTTWVLAHERRAAGVLAAIRAGRVTISAMPDGPRLELRACTAAAEAGMGETLAVAPGEEIDVQVHIACSSSHELRIVADGAPVWSTGVSPERSTVQARVRAARYLRAELMGDCPPELLPPDAPPGLDLRGWRWALSGPVYLQR